MTRFRTLIFTIHVCIYVYGRERRNLRSEIGMKEKKKRQTRRQARVEKDEDDKKLH